ncbi:MAG: flagellar hook protein [Lachnospiraceae bacterium]|nr:flagellar hook protein [Lachnospiraceae bacterium]
MVVKHNLIAMNSERMLGITMGTQAKSTEKLSSGYKINRAADDAAGLAISEKMRKQIRGLTQASLNAEDGISAVQTAEGALTEVHDMLQRMNELAVKAANGTMSESDRGAVQSEIDQLVTEIDRVSTTTKFNETYLLRGNSNGDVGKLRYTTAMTALTGEDGDEDFAVKSEATTLSGILKADVMGEAAADPDVNMATGVIKTEVQKINGDFGALDALKDVEGDAGELQDTVDADILEAVANSSMTGVAFKVGEQGITYVTVYSTGLGSAGDDSKAIASVSEVVDVINAGSKEGNGTEFKAFASLDEMMSAIKRDHGTDIKEVTSYVDDTDPDAPATMLKIETFANLNDAVDLSLHVGADSGAENKINMNIAQMSARGLGVNGLRVDGDTADNATKAIDTIADALQKVSNQRSSLGAVQNRLEHTIANLDNIVENTTAAESQIRDTDMANEMVSYSNNQILAQAGQAMLAQSNQANQGVLSLLG